MPQNSILRKNYFKLLSLFNEIIPSKNKEFVLWYVLKCTEEFTFYYIFLSKIEGFESLRVLILLKNYYTFREYQDCITIKQNKEQLHKSAMTFFFSNEWLLLLCFSMLRSRKMLKSIYHLRLWHNSKFSLCLVNWKFDHKHIKIIK